MKTKYTSQNRSAGYALMLVMIMCAASLLIMAGIMNRTWTISNLNNRNNQLAQCNAVANAATEKVFARMAYEFQQYGLGTVTNHLGIYWTNIKTGAENPYWGNFVFSDAQGNTNRTYVNFLTNYTGPLPTQYTNLFTTTSPIYRIISNVSMPGSPGLVGTSQEDVLLALVPITTYAIFYNGPLEFTQCATMTVRGRVHANDIICVGTGINISSSPPLLTFNGIVTSTKTVDGPQRDGLTPNPWNERTVFNAGYSTNIPTVTVSMSMTNTHAIIEIPPGAESPSSQQGLLRLYNQAQVVIVVTNKPSNAGTNIPWMTLTIQQNSVIPGADGDKKTYPYIYTNNVFTNFTIAPSLQPNGIEKFLSVTKQFTDIREYQTNMFVTEINVDAYADWLTTNPFVLNLNKFSALYPPTILYLADRRDVGTSPYKLSVVRLANANQLPNNSGRGWTVATQNPLYVKGNYNITADGIHFATKPDQTTNANTCVPAALLCDAITILSSSFNDVTGTGSRPAAAAPSNTVNAAVITGNVPSTDVTATTFSGGVHNLMRLQENWGNGSKYVIMNTSIVVLFASQMATHQFRNPVGWSPAPINPYYTAPIRLWGFDPNFYDPAKQPPGIPTALVPIRFNWTTPPPGTTNANIGDW
jgi:hypothetical protein